MNNYSEFYKNFKEIESAAKAVWKQYGTNYSDSGEIVYIDKDSVRFEYEAHCRGRYTESYAVYASDIDAYLSTEKEKP